MPTASCRSSTVVPDRPLTASLRDAPSLAAAFDAVSASRGESPAVRVGEDQVSYAELERRAAAITHSLRRLGVERGSLVAIYLPRSIEMIAAMLGVSKAGAAYLPLDPTFPVARVLDTLSDAQPLVFVTEPALHAQLGDPATPVLYVEAALAASPSRNSSKESWAEAEPDDLAYVIYTSGSTGRPKGVMVSQRNVLRLLAETEPWFHFDENDVWTMFHSFAFDFSVWEIWGCLLTGGTLVIVPYETSRSPEPFHALLSRERVTVLNQTPTAFGLLSRAAEAHELPLSLRYVIFGGEALNLRSLRPWVQRFGDAHPQLINMYGITETTVHVTYRRILAGDIERETESLIGQPIPDLQLHLLGDAGEPVAPGEVGEMYVGGDGVALGYLGRPELTRERFLPNPFSPGRLYRSGDLARRRDDGELVYLGRADRQVKINGFRVEPGEIEAALAGLPAMQQVCVIPWKGAEDAHFLAAYFVATEPVDTSLLAVSLAETLPVHMRPTFYRQLPTLPLTVNGKVDREALPRPDALAGGAPDLTAGAPLSEQIASLWSSILQVRSVSESENFFDAGGTSLQLLALRSSLQQRLGRDVPVLWLFEHTTPQSLAARLSQAPSRDAARTPAAPARSAADRQRESFARARALRSTPS